MCSPQPNPLDDILMAAQLSLSDVCCVNTWHSENYRYVVVFESVGTSFKSSRFVSENVLLSFKTL